MPEFLRAFWDGLYFHPILQNWNSQWLQLYCFISSGPDSLLVIYLCDPILYKWEWTERKALPRLLLLLPAIGTSTAIEPDIESKDGKVWVKTNDKYKEGKIVAEGKK